MTAETKRARSGAPRISNAEWEIMNVVWQRWPLAASEVVEALAGRTPWHARTIKTMLGRLVRKGALRFEAEGKRYLYRPAVTRAECVRRESRSFLQRVFDGQTADLLVHFVETARLSREESEQLRRLLDERTGDRS